MASYTNTAKYLLRKLTGSSLVNEIDTGFASLADDVDANMAGYAEGSALPAAGKAGRFFRRTTDGKVFIDTGSAWVEMGFAATAFQTGDVKYTSRSDIPAGWLKFDGQTPLRATYPDLWALAQTEIAAGNTLYTNGNGTTTFGLADLRGRGLIMAGQGSGLTNRALGTAGGEENHVLATAELAAHTHPDNIAYGSAGAHNHGAATGGINKLYGSLDNGTGSFVAAAWVSGPSLPLFLTSTDTEPAHSHAKSGGVQTAGSGTGHNNMQPWRALSLLVKT